MPIAPVLVGKLIHEPADVRLIAEIDETYEDLHSILLMTLSPYFHVILRKIFDQQQLEQPASIIIKSADHEVLKVIKQYAYEGKLTNLNKDNLEKVYVVADMYNIIAILNECCIMKTKLNV